MLSLPTVSLLRRHTFIRAGDVVDCLYLVTQGEIEIYHDLTLVGGPGMWWPD